MLNTARQQQFQNLIAESGWDRLLVYGHSWRKDYFRSLVNFSFFGPHAAAILEKSGDVRILTSHPWDRDALDAAAFDEVRLDSDFDRGLSALLRRRR